MPADINPFALTAGSAIDYSITDPLAFELESRFFSLGALACSAL
jgi:hypothetical protein